MRRLSRKRLLQAASRILTALAVPFAILWVMRALRPAIACGVLDALGRGDWSAAYACVDQADYDALVTVILLAASAVAWIASRRVSDTPIGEYHPTPVEQARNRKGMIDRIGIRVNEELDQTLYQAVLMSLGMTLRPAAPRPGSVRLRRTGEAERPVPEHVSTVRLLDQAQHTLLILGEPGSGKTTMMLDLTRSLLERAREDENAPIPVVFNLSSLTDPEQSLDDWLVVCCRQDEYAELVADDAAVEGADAVVLQPLTPGQIKGYLADLAGLEPERLWRALLDDAVLLELADTPLMLNVMLLAAKQLDWSALPSDQGREAVRSHIYDAYIRSMLARPRNTGKRYPDEKTLHWLHWLAGKMVAHGQTVFLLERMKRSWYNNAWQSLAWFPVAIGPGGLADIDVQEKVRLRVNRTTKRRHSPILA